MLIDLVWHESAPIGIMKFTSLCLGGKDFIFRILNQKEFSTGLSSIGVKIKTFKKPHDENNE
jgi:hypothetical protein